MAISIKQVPKLGAIIAYADNILLLATEALLAALEAHPVGRLQPRGTVFKPGQPVDFLGHRLTPVKEDLCIDPDPSNLEEFETEVMRGLAKLSKTKHKQARARIIKELRRYIRSWTGGAFKLCTNINSFRAYWLAKIPIS